MLAVIHGCHTTYITHHTPFISVQPPPPPPLLHTQHPHDHTRRSARCISSTRCLSSPARPSPSNSAARSGRRLESEGRGLTPLHSCSLGTNCVQLYLLLVVGLGAACGCVGVHVHEHTMSTSPCTHTTTTTTNATNTNTPPTSAWWSPPPQDPPLHYT